MLYNDMLLELLFLLSYIVLIHMIRWDTPSCLFQSGNLTFQVFSDILHDLLNPSGQDLKVNKNDQLGV